MESTHENALLVKHHGLERRIREEMNRPSPNGAVLQSLKKQKLRIKEELAHI